MEAVHVPAVGIQVYGAQLCKQPLLELSSCQGIRAQPSYPFICEITLKPANFLKVGNPLVQQTPWRQQMASTISWGIDLDVVVALTARHLWTLWTLELALCVIPRASEPPLCVPIRLHVAMVCVRAAKLARELSLRGAPLIPVWVAIRSPRIARTEGLPWPLP